MARGLYEARLERDLESVRKRIRRMGRAVVIALRNATRSTLQHDSELATATVLGDMPINRLDREVDHRCHLFIAKHLPTGGHLRFVSSAMRLSKTLERIGDYAQTIARASLHLSQAPPAEVARDIQMLGEHAAEVLQQSLAAYDQASVVDARATKNRVGQFGDTFDQVFSHLVAAGESRDHPMEDLFSLEAICNRLERVLHQAKNICEQTIFAVTGERKEEKTFDFLFVDSRGDGASLLAANYCRRAYPDAGTFRYAGWSSIEEPDQAFVSYAEGLGVDLSMDVPVSFSDVKGHIADYDIVVDLGGRLGKHLRKIPFHTTVLNWPMEEPQNPEAVYQQLVHKLGDLMEILRGEDDD